MRIFIFTIKKCKIKKDTVIIFSNGSEFTLSEEADSNSTQLNELDQEDSVEENDSEGTTQDKGTDLLRQKKPALAGLSFHYAFDSKKD